MNKIAPRTITVEPFAVDLNAAVSNGAPWTFLPWETPQPHSCCSHRTVPDPTFMPTVADHLLDEMAGALDPLLDENIRLSRASGELNALHGPGQIASVSFHRDFATFEPDPNRLAVFHKVGQHNRAIDIDLNDPGFIEAVAEKVNGLYAKWLDAKDKHREAWLSGWTP